MQHRILVLEDNPADRDLIILALRRSGLEFIHRHVDRKEPFVRAIEEFRPDIVLADYHLPDMDGRTALRIVKARRSDLPVIIVTGTLGDELAASIMREGAADYVLKESLARLPMAVTKAIAVSEDRVRRERAEAESRANRQRLELLFQSTLDGIVILNDRGRIIDANPSALAVLRTDLEKLSGKLWSDVARHEELDEPADLTVTGEKHARYRARTTARKNDGAEVVIDMTYVSEQGPDGRPLVFIVFRDVTDQIAAENALRRERALKSLLAEIGEDLVLRADVNEAFREAMARIARFIDWPVAHLFLLEELRDSLVNTEIWIGAEADAFDELKEVSKTFLDQDRGGPITASLRARRAIWIEDLAKEIWFYRRDPALRAGLVSALAVPIVIGDRTVAAVEFFSHTARPVDDALIELLRPVGSQLGRIAERRSFSERIIRREKELEALIRNAPDIIERVDRELRYTLVSPSAERILGVPVAELIGRMVWEAQPGPPADVPGGVDEWTQALRQVFEDGTARDVELERPAGRKIVRLHSRIVPEIGESGRVDSVLSFTRDITRQFEMQKSLEERDRQLERAQRLESVGRLAGGIAHDFNNILTAITGYLHLAQLPDATVGEVKEYLKNVKDASDRASRLTRQLLIFSRKAPTEMQSVDINRIVAEMVKMLTRLVGERISVETNLEENLPVIRADPGKIEQVLMNLVVNARDAMPGGGRIVISTAAVLRAGGSESEAAGVRLTVRDSGTGMDSETIRKIFEPFFTTKNREEGTGLGLAVVSGIVDEHGGTISVESEPGHGSTFSIELPSTTANTAADTAATPGPSPAESRMMIRVLVVEDDPAIRAVAEKAMTSAGMVVTTAESLGRALEKLESGGIDLVVSDVVLPDGSGIDLAERAGKSTPFVFTSGYVSRREDLERVRVSGHAFLQKPYDVHELVNVARAAARGRRQS